MSLSVRHCPKCGAMQPAVERCGVCGARLPSSAGAAGGASETVSRHEATRLAVAIVALLIGVVACGVLAMVAFYAVL